MSQRYIGGLIYNPPGGFSGAFDGVNNQYISAPNNTALSLPSGTAFTIEAWIFPTRPNNGAQSGFRNIISKRASNSLTSNYNIMLWFNSEKLGFFNGSTSSLSAANIPQNTWTHFAYVYDGGTSLKLYINGILDTNFSTTPGATNSADVWIGSLIDDTGTYDNFGGYISNARIVKGSQVYTSAFNPPSGQLQAITNTSLLTCAYGTFRDGSTNNFTITVNGNTAVSVQNPFPLTQLPNPALGNQGNGVYTMSQYQALRSQNLWPAVDPYWEYVTLMLHGNGTNGAQNNTFLDSSTNNFTITRNGNTTQGTFSPFGSNWSNYFAGSQSINAASSSSFQLTGDFTIECWIFRTGTGDQSAYVQASGSNYLALNVNAGTGFNIYLNSGSPTISPTDIVPATNVWNHIALVRSGSTVKVYLNGVASATTATNSSTLGYNAVAYVGALGTQSAGSTVGYISNMRVVTSAVYTSNFTPPTAPFSAISGTVLLTCQSNRFIDNSTNAFTITRNGDVSVQRFSPFSPTAPYAAGTDGGSGYFDGTGDQLSLANNSAFDVGSGDFTVEAWVYLTGTTGSVINYSNGQTQNSNFAWEILQNSATSIQVSIASSNTVYIASSTALVANAWNHVAGVRNGNTLTVYVNGVAGGTTATVTGVTVNNPSGATVKVSGYNNSTFMITGYVSNARLVKGTAVYTSAFTPPTAPLTAITNTSLLLNFTNAGVIDNAEMNVLETVGNAQISTAQSKFGGASIGLGSNDAYLLTAPTVSLEFGSGDFTIEFWWYPTSTSRQALYHGSFGADWSIGIDYSSVSTNQKIGIWASSNGSSWNLINADGGGNGIGTITITQNAWNHIAYVRSGTTWMLFVNGVRDLNLTGISGSVVNRATYSKGIGVWWNTTAMAEASGYIDDLRITKGYARYTSTFTPQRSQWQDQ